MLFTIGESGSLYVKRKKLHVPKVLTIMARGGRPKAKLQTKGKVFFFFFFIRTNLGQYNQLSFSEISLSNWKKETVTGKEDVMLTKCHIGLSTLSSSGCKILFSHDTHSHLNQLLSLTLK